MFLLLITIRDSLYVRTGVSASELSTRLDVLVLGLIAACWVERDARKRGDVCPVDQVVFFAWLLFPVPVLSTRGWRGIVTLLMAVFGLLAARWIPILFLR